MLNSSLLQRLRNNFMVVEVWNRIGPHDHADQVIKFNFLFHLIIFINELIVYIPV